MFNFFRKKNAITVVDRIFFTTEKKINACATEVKNNNDTLIVCWFDETNTMLQEYFSTAHLPLHKIVWARELVSHHVKNKHLIFAEHYPLLQKEIALYKKLSLSAVVVFSSFDEPLLKHFGGDKILEMIKKMGAKDDEVMENPTISAALKRIQKKIEKQITLETDANSQEEWFIKNYNPGS